MAVHQREARIQTLEPMPWMTEVERFGHATRKRVPQSQQDVYVSLDEEKNGYGITCNHSHMSYSEVLDSCLFKFKDFV